MKTTKPIKLTREQRWERSQIRFYEAIKNLRESEQDYCRLIFGNFSHNNKAYFVTSHVIQVETPKTFGKINIPYVLDKIDLSKIRWYQTDKSFLDRLDLGVLNLIK